MKKRIYLIIVSTLQIIFNIIAIINAQNIINETLETLNNLPFTLDDRMLSIYSSTKLVIVPAIICIITSLTALIISAFNKIEKTKGLLIFIFVLNVLFSNYSICNVLSVISVVVCITIKNEIKEKQEMPILPRIDNDKKSTILGILVIAIYFSQSFLNLININSFALMLILDILVNIIILGICVIIFKNNLKRDISYLKNNFKGYLSYIGPKLGIMYVVYFFVCIITSVISGNTSSVNEQMIESLPLYYTIPLVCIVAPITEEIVFRGSIRRIIKNDKLFIIVSGLIFGLLHTIYEATLFNAIIMCSPYALLGGFFAYIYTKTNNITTNISCHAFHNSFVMLLQILLLH